MNETSELDRIINEGKVSPATAMVVFAVELKSQGDKLDNLTKTINEDNKRYATREDYQSSEKRISRLENAILGLLGFVFITVLGALITLLLKQGGSA